jgi:5-formyltetrahydrofolate cyclo-ligase
MMKKELRSYFLDQRNTLPAEIHEELSVLICDNILSSAVWKEYDDILMYVPFSFEVDIFPLIDIAWREGKKVFLPKIDTLNSVIIPIEYKRYSTLVKGPYGIMEPQSEDNIHIDPIEFKALCLVPLLACDKYGYRLGYGGGYYDKIFALYSNLFRCGIGFSFQKYSNDLPIEQHDIAMMAFCNEEQMEYIQERPAY